MVYKLKPNRVYRSYYGGKRLDDLYGHKNPENSRYPEEWVASTARAFNAGREDRVEGYSLCESGERLIDLIKENPIGMLGTEQVKLHGERTSILVKLLDSAERLFIQCHPTIEFAKKNFNSDFGKTECWYIISAEPDSCVYIGFRKGITKEKWKRCFISQNVDEMLSLMHRINVKSGDLIFVDGGVPHAIGANCFLCELQEPTDLMVIPERTSKSGIMLSDEKMHCGLGFDKMFDCFNYEGYSEKELCNKYVRRPVVNENSVTPIVNSNLTDKFNMDMVYVKGTVCVEYKDKYAVAIVLEGECNLQYGNRVMNLKQGNELFISASNGVLKFDGSSKIMICSPQ